jgi:hypothetical protein
MGRPALSFNSPQSRFTAVPDIMPKFVDPSLQWLRRKGRPAGRGVAGVGVALMLGLTGPAFPRPPFEAQQDRGWRQMEDSHRAEIRRSLGRSGEDVRQDGYRERRRMSEEERQSLRQAVRDAYGDPRGRRRD